jgi:hypothetical protein
MKMIGKATNPLLPNKLITVFDTTTNVCDFLKSKDNFLKRLLFEKFEKSNNITMECPLEKRVYQISDWLVDGNKIIPRSLTIPGNISLYLEFLTNLNSTGKKIFLYSLQVLLELKKR